MSDLSTTVSVVIDATFVQAEIDKAMAAIDYVREEIGRIADTLDAGVHASRMPLPADLHIRCMRSLMERAVADLGQLIKTAEVES